MIKTILFPTDFSELSLKAFSVVVDLATNLESELHLVHVIDSGAQIVEGENLLEDVQQKVADSRFHRLLNGLHRDVDTDKIHRTILRGEPSHCILRYAENNKIDLLFTPTHGYSGLKRLWMGSVATKLMRQSSIPTFIYNPKNQKDFDLKNVSTIFMPTDFSDHSNKAVQLAAFLAQSLNCTLTVVHALSSVRETVGIYGDAFSLVGRFGSFSGFLTEQKEEAQKALKKLEGELHQKFPSLVGVSAMLLEGQPDEAIVKQCNQDIESILVMSTHGYSGLDHFIMGSVTERVAVESSSPVLALHVSSESD